MSGDICQDYAVNERRENLRIVLAEDHPIARKLIRMQLEREEGLELAGETGDGLEAVALVSRHRPRMYLSRISGYLAWTGSNLHVR